MCVVAWTAPAHSNSHLLLSTLWALSFLLMRNAAHTFGTCVALGKPALCGGGVSGALPAPSDPPVPALVDKEVAAQAEVHACHLLAACHARPRPGRVQGA